MNASAPATTLAIMRILKHVAEYSTATCLITARMKILVHDLALWVR